MHVKFDIIKKLVLRAICEFNWEKAFDNKNSDERESPFLIIPSTTCSQISILIRHGFVMRLKT